MHPLQDCKIAHALHKFQTRHQLIPMSIALSEQLRTSQDPSDSESRKSLGGGQNICRDCHTHDVLKTKITMFPTGQ
jgi:hypothetical protein